MRRLRLHSAGGRFGLTVAGLLVLTALLAPVLTPLSPDAINLGRATALVAGRPLEELPPGAFTLPSRKTRTAPPDPEDGDPGRSGATRADRPRRQPKPRR